MLVIFLIFLSVLLVMGGVVLGLYGWRNLRTASLLGHPLSRVAKLRPGLHKVRGKVGTLDKVLRSPVTNRPCVYYRLRVYEDRTTYQDPSSGSCEPLLGRDPVLDAIGASYRSTGGMREVHSWHSLLDDAYDIPFTIEDDTGWVEVDLRGATVFAREKARIVSNVNHAPPSTLVELLRKEYGIHTVDNRGFFKTLHFMEEVLLVGAKVTVVGPVEQFKSGDLCFQQKGDSLLVSERDVGKESREARGRAVGFVMGSTAALTVGLGCLLGAVVLVVQALLAG